MAASVGTLLYFPLRARGEPIRFLLAYTGLPYANETVNFVDWPSLKPTFPGGTVPQWRATGADVLMPETGDIMRHVAWLGRAKFPSLDPVADPTKMAQARRLFDLANTALNDVNPLTNWFPVDVAFPKIPVYLTKALGILADLSAELEASGGPFFGGVLPHYGDFGLFHVVNLMHTLQKAEVGQKPLLSALKPCWAAWYQAMLTLPNIAAYIASRPVAGTGAVGREGSRLATMLLDA